MVKGVYMEQSNIYKLLALTTIVSILISVGAFTLMKDNFIGPQGLQGKPGESIVGPMGLQGEAGESIVGPIGPQGEPGESIVGPQGIQGPQGEQGEPFPYEGEWGLTYDTFTTEADFMIVQPYYIYNGDSPEYAYMSISVYEGKYATGDPLIDWVSSYDWGGTSLMVFGKGTYTIKARDNYYTDTWIKIWEFLPPETEA